MTYFEDYELAVKRVSHGRTVTEADIVLHAGQTGDFYPHHMDAEFAKSLPGGQRVAHGTLILAISVGLLASEINEEAMSYGYDRVRFIKPVHIGDTITAYSEIVAMRERADPGEPRGIVEERVEVINQRGDVVLAFAHLYIVNCRPGVKRETDGCRHPAQLE